jgi:hypothetical protein
MSGKVTVIADLCNCIAFEGKQDRVEGEAGSRLIRHRVSYGRNHGAAPPRMYIQRFRRLKDNVTPSCGADAPELLA